MAQNLGFMTEVSEVGLACKVQSWIMGNPVFLELNLSKNYKIQNILASAAFIPF